jgi:predicted amidohydrolase YtcJ
MEEGTEQADVAFVGGGVFTVDATGRWADAVAVRAGRIVAVGTTAAIGAVIGPRTQVVELSGRLLVPGFQDAHVHAPSAGLNRLRCDLSEVHGAPAYVDAIARHARERQDADWILGGGWAMDSFPGGSPHRDLLDAVVADRPVCLMNRDCHAVWVNGRALELAGISGETPDPRDGRIERDERGEPIGTLHEGAMELVARLIPATSHEDQLEGLLVAQRHLHSLGITGWQDAIVGEYATMKDSLDVYRSAAADGQLTARVVGALWWDRDRGVEQIPELLARRETGTAGRFRATSVKIMQDGVCESLTAAVLDPYLDASGKATTNRGISFVDPEELPGYVTALDAHGFQVHVHAIGERANRDALDAFAAARSANPGADNRHHIAHVQLVHPTDVPRFRQLRVTANIQPLWAVNDHQLTELTMPRLGPDRSDWMYGFRDLWEAGAQLAIGSDWPVSSPDPVELLHVAVNRMPPPGYLYGQDEDAGPFRAEQALPLRTAITAYTMGSAYVNHLDHEVGSIEVGKAADLVVLDRNLFDVEPSEIGAARALLTMVEGQVVHEAAGL